MYADAGPNLHSGFARRLPPDRPRVGGIPSPRGMPPLTFCWHVFCTSAGRHGLCTVHAFSLALAAGCLGALPTVEGMAQPFVITPRGRPASSDPAMPFDEVETARHAEMRRGATTVVPPLAERIEFDEAFGDLAEHCADERVTDVFVNGTEGLFVDRGAGMEKVAGWGVSEREARDLAVSLIGLGGRHIDDRSPCVDVRLSSGIRVHAVLSPVAVGGAAISLRIPRIRAADLSALAALGTINADQQRWLETLVHERANVLITGGTGTGKTTLLSALLAHVPAHERIVTIEDVAELRPRHPHHVALETRQENLEGAGGIALDRLVRESLRMRPDRLIVGECRGEEIRDLLTALNTGHDGGAGTLHASGIDDVPARLEALGALAGMSTEALARQAISAFHIVLHVVRTPSGQRLLHTAGVLTLDGQRLDIREVQPWH